MAATIGDRGARRRLSKQAARGRGALVVTLALTLLALLVLLTGCKIEMALDTVVKADGSGTIGIRLAADKEIQDLIAQQGGGEGDIFGEFESGVPEGWESDNGTDPDGTRWVTASRSFADPAEIKSFLEEGGAQGPAESVGAREFSLTQESGLLSVKTVFSASWDMQEALAGTGENAPAGMTPDALSSIFVVQNRLTLPGSIQDNNADEVNGNTLVWKPSLSGTTQMNATSVAYKWPVIGGIAAVVVLLLAAIVALVVLSARRRRGAHPPTVPVPAQPAGPADGSVVTGASMTTEPLPADTPYAPLGMPTETPIAPEAMPADATIAPETMPAETPVDGSPGGEGQSPRT